MTLTKLEQESLIRTLRSFADKIASLEAAVQFHDHSQPQQPHINAGAHAPANSESSLQTAITELERTLKGAFKGAF